MTIHETRLKGGVERAGEIPDLRHKNYIHVLLQWCVALARLSCSEDVASYCYSGVMHGLVCF